MCRILRFLSFFSIALLGLTIFACRTTRRGSIPPNDALIREQPPGKCAATLSLVQPLPKVDVSKLSKPQIEIKEVPISKNDGSPSGNSQAKISVNYQVNDKNGHDLPDVIYFRFCSVNDKKLPDCINAVRGQALAGDQRLDGIISSAVNESYNPGLPEGEQLKAFAWSCVWSQRATKSRLKRVVRIPTQFANRELVCNSIYGSSETIFRQQKNKRKLLEQRMVKNFDNLAGMQGLAYLSVKNFQKYLDAVENVKLEPSHNLLRSQIASNIALGETYALFLTSNFSSVLRDLEIVAQDRIEKDPYAFTAAESFSLAAKTNPDCMSESEVVNSFQVAGNTDSHLGSKSRPPAAGSLSLAAIERSECLSRSPRYQYVAGRCLLIEPSPEIEDLGDLAELEAALLMGEKEHEQRTDILRSIGSWTLIFAGSLALPLGVASSTLGLKAINIKSDLLVDPYFLNQTQLLAARAKTRIQDLKRGLAPARAITFDSRLRSAISFTKYAEIIRYEANAKAISLLKQAGAKGSLGKKPYISPEDLRALKVSGQRLIVGGLGSGLLGALMLSLGGLSQSGLLLSAEPDNQLAGPDEALKNLREGLEQGFKTYKKFMASFNATADQISEFLL